MSTSYELHRDENDIAIHLDEHSNRFDLRIQGEGFVAELSDLEVFDIANVVCELLRNLSYWCDDSEKKAVLHRISEILDKEYKK